MAERERPNPDALLAAISPQESEGRGKLKIFLGAAAGVGKTYNMLEAAHARLDEGVDVVAGYVETHHRQDTEELLAGLEVIPARQVKYRGVTLEEMDLDAILARRPELVLVDELAHTNAEGSRHPKRYQDVEEILDQGISVYTALNVQHLESLNDVVAQITGVRVRETVPDRIFEQADDVELIDLPPEELRQRLAEGKVYVPEQSKRAMHEFFRSGNLHALRELALRRTAQQVDREMRAYMVTHGIQGPWPAGDRVLVCLSANRAAERLVRTGRRLATSLDADLIVLYVETPEHRRLPGPQRSAVTEVLQLAEELDAHTATLAGLDPAQEIIQYIKRHNITKVVLGRPLWARWREVWRGSIIDQVVRACPGVDVHVISTALNPSEVAVKPLVRPRVPGRRWAYVDAVVMVALITLLGRLALSRVDPINLVMLYLLAVVIGGVVGGTGPAALTATLGVLSFDFFLVPPYYTFAVSDTQYLLTFAALLAVALTTGTLTGRIQQQVSLSRDRENETAALFTFSKSLVGVQTLPEIASALVKCVQDSFDREAGVLVPVSGHPEIISSSDDFRLDDKEAAAAAWTLQHGQPSGRGESNLPGVEGRYLPLTTGHGTIGVVAIHNPERSAPLTPDRRRLLEAFTAQAAMAMERAQLHEGAQKMQLLAEADRLHTALLNSISHNLRTPLASIIGSLTTLLEEQSLLRAETRQDLVENARDAALDLNRMVTNLLDVTRLESGSLKLIRGWYEPGDVIATAIEQVRSRLSDRRVDVRAPKTLPLLFIDHTLIVQVLANLLENAAKYSPGTSPIEVAAEEKEGAVEVRVLDRGKGIAPADLERVFEKFYRAGQTEKADGVGLGLAICQGIVQLHGGQIWIRPRPDGGTVAGFTLPTGEAEEGAVSGRGRDGSG